MLDDVQPRHRLPLKQLVEDTGFFTEEEVGIAVELVDERLAKGDASEYFFVMAEIAGKLAGYTCFGPIAGSDASYDLYWIAVDPTLQRRGIGKILMNETARRIGLMGGKRIYIDTSLRPDYAPTRAFYIRCGFTLDAGLEDFYRPGDGKAIFVRVVDTSA
ncbi:MAG: GNAT family N-acetyltransferase [Phycisphaeraceae bacterium]|nr:GNAT family N-acetyltransferase [Phycisphaeraceae bacterium]